MAIIGSTRQGGEDEQSNIWVLKYLWNNLNILNYSIFPTDFENEFFSFQSESTNLLFHQISNISQSALRKIWIDVSALHFLHFRGKTSRFLFHKKLFQIKKTKGRQCVGSLFVSYIVEAYQPNHIIHLKNIACSMNKSL